jgi:endonuclease YncB( thermonuclease family)
MPEQQPPPPPPSTTPPAAADVIARCPQALRDCAAAPPLFSLAGRALPAKLFRVYDGDSAYMAVVLADGQPPVSLRVRLRGVDTPELRSKDPEVRRLAYAARDHVRALVEGQVCCVRCHAHDKYGRVLVDVQTPGGTDVAASLLERGMAIPYEGTGRRFGDKLGPAADKPAAAAPRTPEC